MPVDLTISVQLRLPWRARLKLRIGAVFMRIGARLVGAAVDAAEVAP